ncbi:MAG: hypothetical protein L0211_02550 [Planctomycetaceae bacterium]|nr:hypothetical protein [Planctomycetaceae bacterium]
MSHPPKLWLTGEIGHADFALATKWLHEKARCEIIPAGSPAAAGSDFPVAIVFFQARPGSVLQSDVERLHRLAPLARLVILAGPWCEGELRWNRLPHGTTQILWHQWRWRLPRELGLFPQGSPIAAILPRTMSRVDCLLATIPSGASSSAPRGAAVIATDRRESFESLADLCRLAGLRAVWQQGQSPTSDDRPAVVIAQGWQALADLSRDDQSTLLGKPAVAPGDNAPRPPVILLLDWPRPDDLARAGQLGIRHVLSLPLLVTDWLTAVEELLPQQAASGAANSAA